MAWDWDMGLLLRGSGRESMGRVEAATDTRAARGNGVGRWSETQLSAYNASAKGAINKVVVAVKMCALQSQVVHLSCGIKKSFDARSSDRSWPALRHEVYYQCPEPYHPLTPLSIDEGLLFVNLNTFSKLYSLKFCSRFSIGSAHRETTITST